MSDVQSALKLVAASSLQARVYVQEGGWWLPYT